MAQTARHHMEFLRYHNVDQTTHTVARIYSEDALLSAVILNAVSDTHNHHYNTPHYITLQCEIIY